MKTNPQFKTPPENSHILSSRSRSEREAAPRNGAWRTLLAAVIAAWSLPAAAVPIVTFTDLNPDWAGESFAYGVSATQQIGYAFIKNTTSPYALLWSGASNSWVDLNPPGARYSMGFALSDTQQGGYALFGGMAHAVYWSGASNFFVDLHPAGARESWVYALNDSQQAGAASFDVGGYRHSYAALWHGTSNSFVNLNPAKSGYSYVYAVSGTQQVGYATIGHDHAGIWSGDQQLVRGPAPGGSHGIPC